MYEIRCPNCNKKLAETTRKVSLKSSHLRKEVIAEGKSSYSVFIKCKRCKTIVKF